MAEFEIENAEGSHWVKCTLHDETVIAERGRSPTCGETSR